MPDYAANGDDYYPTSPCYSATDDNYYSPKSPDYYANDDYSPTSPQYEGYSLSEDNDVVIPSFRPYGLIFEDYLRDLESLETLCHERFDKEVKVVKKADRPVRACRNINK